MTTTHEVRIRWTGKDFRKAVANAKRLDGTYNATTKTWTVKIPEATATDMGGSEEYLRFLGLALVAAPAFVQFS